VSNGDEVLRQATLIVIAERCRALGAAQEALQGRAFDAAGRKVDAVAAAVQKASALARLVTPVPGTNLPLVTKKVG